MSKMWKKLTTIEKYIKLLSVPPNKINEIPSWEENEESLSCAMKDLRINNNLFDHKPKHKITQRTPRFDNRLSAIKQIDTSLTYLVRTNIC